MALASLFTVTALSGLYTALWGAFKDCPYEGFKPRTFPRSIYFNLAVLLALLLLPPLRPRLLELSLFQVFFVTMGAERFLAELYKGFFRTEDQTKYYVPSRITFFGHHVASELLRQGAGAAIVAALFLVMLLEAPVRSFPWFAVTAYATGLVVALGGAYKDAPFEGFKPLKFQRSAVVLAALSPLFYFVNDPARPVPLGFLAYMNIGLERFAVEYYKTYIQRHMSGKFRPDLARIQHCMDTRERFHYLALVLMAALALLYAAEVRGLRAAAAG